MSLRARVIAAVAFIAVVLTVVLVFVTRTTEQNLLSQVDEQLADAVQPVRRFDFGDRPGRRPGARPDPPGGRELSSLYVGSVQGDVVSTLVSPGLRGTDLSLPVVSVQDAVAAARSGEPFTAASDGSDLRWRLRAYGPRTGSDVTVIGLPLDAVDDAVSDLITLELAAAGVIFAFLALVAFWVIHLGIRPVHKMTEVATAIASGDLTRRVPDTDPNTEAGQLGDALNRMLASIEATFDERRRIEERLRQFVGDASHELRTPVATIRGYAELYRVGALGERERLDDAMRRTEQEAIRMGGLVDDLLSLARLDQGRPLQLSEVDLSLVARDAVSDALAIDPSRAVTVHSEEPALVRADEAKVRQIVASVVGNALVHTPPDASIAITTGTTEDGHCFIEVADDGPGMPPEVASRAFERFFRADPSRSRHHGGSGLGLAIVDATVRAHGGDVALRSEPGQGTTVRIALPAGAPGG